VLSLRAEPCVGWMASIWAKQAGCIGRAAHSEVTDLNASISGEWGGRSQPTSGTAWPDGCRPTQPRLELVLWCQCDFAPGKRTCACWPSWRLPFWGLRWGRVIWPGCSDHAQPLRPLPGSGPGQADLSLAPRPQVTCPNGRCREHLAAATPVRRRAVTREKSLAGDIPAGMDREGVARMAGGSARRASSTLTASPWETAVGRRDRLDTRANLVSRGRQFRAGCASLTRTLGYVRPWPKCRLRSTGKRD
jgi:hypothetical protein